MMKVPTPQAQPGNRAATSLARLPSGDSRRLESEYQIISKEKTSGLLSYAYGVDGNAHEEVVYFE